MSSPANRTALREEENRPAPPSQQVMASAVTGPTPYSRSASTLAPVRPRAASSSRCRSTSRRASSAASMPSAVSTCSCPAGDRRQAGGGGRGIGRRGAVRRDAGAGELLRDVPPAGAPLQRERDVVPAGEPRQPGPQVRAVGRGDLAALHLPGPGIEVVERELLPV